jgi:hypothetical protein
MKVGEHPKMEKPEVCEFKNPIALVLTYNRAGLLIGTVKSFLETVSNVPLHVFDDGSESAAKHSELDCLEDVVKVHRLPHCGFVESWRAIFRFVRALNCYDSVITLEDDIVFAKGWLDVLKSMQAGIADLGLLQGMTSCFRPHSEPQSQLIDLRGIRAYQSMAHSFHVNLMPIEVVNREDVFDESAKEVISSKSGKGLDVYWVGNISHRLHRCSFVSEQSWVAHIGFESVVSKQDYGACRHPGFELVPELKVFEKGWVC